MNSNQIEVCRKTYAISLLVLEGSSPQLRFGIKCNEILITVSYSWKRLDLKGVRVTKTEDDFGTSNIKKLSDLGSYHQNQCQTISTQAGKNTLEDQCPSDLRFKVSKGQPLFFVVKPFIGRFVLMSDIQHTPRQVKLDNWTISDFLFRHGTIDGKIMWNSISRVAPYIVCQ